MTGLLFAVAGLVAAAPDPAPAEKALVAYGDWIVGGTWTSTDAAGKKYEYRFDWALGKKFIKLTGKEGDLAFEETIGVDPTTGKWTSWGFDSKGTVWRGEADFGKPGEWTFQLAGASKGGTFSYRLRETKTGADSSKREILEFIEDGKKQPTETMTWTRKK